MNRGKKLLLNSTSSLLYQAIMIISTFILPRFFLLEYGSAVNGLVSSITQFLSFISLCELGVGAVIQSALYGPLAKKDMPEVSKIAASSERFFRKIAYILVAYIALLVVVYPLFVADGFDYVYTAVLILSMAISTFMQYYVGITYKLILSADQHEFINNVISCIAIVLNTVACIVLILLHASIHMVKLTTSIIFLIQPIGTLLIAKRKYAIDTKIQYTGEPIKQKWNGLAQHIASVVHGNTDTVVLTLFSTLENVSVYSVYHMVVAGIRQVITAATNGVQAMIGNMLARDEMETANRTFDYYEWIMHTLVTVIFFIAAKMMLPFVQLYTKGIEDVNYIVPVFSALIVLAQALYCLRLPYNTVVLAAGHYRQTQLSAIIEAVLNIVISVVVVFRFGLVGVAVGTLVAMLYRTCYLAWYLRKNILSRGFKSFVKHMIVDALSVVVFMVFMRLIPLYSDLSAANYLVWIWKSAIVGITCVLLSVVINFLCYPQLIRGLLSKKRNT